MTMTPEVRNGIFAGESGGDYNAVFGFQNRPGGRYENVRLTEMPVGAVIDFTSPSGDYGQWVKGQVGRVATPVGAYQVVGTTLRAAVEALGIDPNQPFDQATQDRIGEWILATQGTGAWEGYRGPSDRAPTPRTGPTIENANALAGVQPQTPYPQQNALAQQQPPQWQYNATGLDPRAFQSQQNPLAMLDINALVRPV